MTTNEQNTQHTQSTPAPLTVLVTGATGRVGSRVAEAARAAGHEVRSASRSGAVRFDWYDASTWADALRGADAAFLAYQPDVGAPGAAEAVGAFARQAVELGVRHLVLLSARGEDQARATEDALAVPGARWTVVRASWFAQNLSEGPLADAMRESGELAFPGGEVLEPFIDVRDIADVVLAVLAAGSRYDGRVLEVSGGRLLSFRDAVAEVSAAVGREFTYIPVPAREYGAALREFGVPDAEVEFLIDLFETNLDGRNAHISPGVQEILGRAPREFSTFVQEAASTTTWKG
ncbi:NmrA family NAD(P)-binding protein [Streptomyces sp. NPDC127108]|uniref:NmrA family NAD(P)-binding protein n=1 Tax=Streptomyces sp. NPDC127108 TaxID=3345361 RepID=UPI00362F4732